MADTTGAPFASSCTLPMKELDRCVQEDWQPCEWSASSPFVGNLQAYIITNTVLC